MFKQSLYPLCRALEEGAREDGVALRHSAAVVHWQWSELGHGEIQRFKKYFKSGFSSIWNGLLVMS